MTSIEIKEKVNEEKRRIEEELKVENQELKLYQDFFRDYSLIDIKNYDKMDCNKFFVLYLHSTDPKKWPLEELEEFVKRNHGLFTTTDSDKLKSIIDRLRDTIEQGLSDITKELIREEHEPLNSYLASEASQSEKESYASTQQKVANLKKAGLDIENLLDLLEKDDENLKQALSLIVTFKEAGEFKEDITEGLTEIMEQENLIITEEEIERAVNKSWSKAIDKKRLFNALNIMKSYYENLGKQESKRRKSLNKQMRDYKQFEQLFPTMQEGGEIKDATAIAEKVANPTLRLEVLKYIYIHNLPLQEQIESDYKNIFKEDDMEYKEFLIRNNLSTDNLESLKTKSIPELEYMLERLKKLNVQELETVLKTSTPHRVQELEVLIKTGVITEEFVKGNISLFDTKKPHYQVLTINKRILQEKRINPSTISKHQEILFATPAYLERNLSTLEEYSFPLNWMNLESVQFLSHPDLARKIDKVLELGYEALLESDIELLNYNDSAWERLEVLKSLNIPLPTTKEEVESILESPHFVVSKEEQERYLETPTAYIKANNVRDIVPVSALPIEKETKRTYTIGGVIFSKPKVLRNLSQTESFTLDGTIACITAGTNMQEKEYQNVKNRLTNYYRK